MAMGLYVHVPFCVKKCEYCSFVSVPRENKLTADYLDALIVEMEMCSGQLAAEEKVFSSVYIGGGTPTCLSADELGKILEELYRFFHIEKNVEITMEINPGTVDRDKLTQISRLGINRLSIGFQSCQPEILELLGRTHSYSEAQSAFRWAREIGFDNINIDLIFGVPGQTVQQWHSCLQEIMMLEPEHISAYGLQIEEGTPLFKRVKDGVIESCSEDLEADMYQCLISTLKDFGYIHYEVSNFAFPGRLCRHNLRYWHNLSYLGMGPSAHSYVRGKRRANQSSLATYIDNLLKGQSPVVCEEYIVRSDEIAETIFLGLRLMDGLDIEEFSKRFGENIKDIYPDEIKKLTDLGLLEIRSQRLRLTERGLMLGNIVFSEFV